MSLDAGHRRIRYIIFDEVDEAKFSLAISAAFPKAQFIPVRSYPQPVFDSRTCLSDCSWIVRVIVPDEGWHPEWIEDKELHRFDVANMPRRSFFYHRSYWYWGPRELEDRWAWKPPTLEEGHLEFRYRRDDLETKKFIQIVLRLARLLSTNRHAGSYSQWHHRMSEIKAGGIYWAGHHALSWCLGGERRALMGAVRPCIDWEEPKTEWHRQLNAQFEAWQTRWPGGKVPAFRDAPAED